MTFPWQALLHLPHTFCRFLFLSNLPLMLESFLVCPGELTDDQVMELLKISFRQPEVVLALAKMVHDVHERSNVQNPLE